MAIVAGKVRQTISSIMQERITAHFIEKGRILPMTKCIECDGEWFELLDHAENIVCDCGIKVCMNCGAEYEADGTQLSYKV